MALSATSMKSRIEAHMAAVASVQVSAAGPAVAYRDAMLLAFCQGIVEEIDANAVVTTSDAQGGTNTGTVA